MTDHRKNPRLSPLVIRVEFPHDGENRHGFLTNLSEGGAYLATKDRIPAKEAFPLRILLPWNLGPVTAEATVVWCAQEEGPHPREYPAGAGLTFTRLSEEGIEKIRRYMQRFHRLVAQIDEEGLEPVLKRLARETGGSESTED